MLKRRFYGACVAIFLVIGFQVSNASHMQAFAASPPPQFDSMTGYDQLQTDVSQWNIFHDQGYTKGRLQGTQAGDGTMKVTLMHGAQSYADILAYRDLQAASGATQFRMSVSFLYHSIASMQALEFTMDKWVNGVRWEWALQWQIVPDGTSLAGVPQSWRMWNGSAWQAMNIHQTLGINQWHTVYLYGEIVQGQVHYVGFMCDTVYTDMSQLILAPAASSGDKLGVGVQLDGNSSETSYPVFYRNVGLHFR